MKVETDLPHDLRAFIRRARDAAVLALAVAAVETDEGPEDLMPPDTFRGLKPR